MGGGEERPGRRPEERLGRRDETRFGGDEIWRSGLPGAGADPLPDIDFEESEARLLTF